MEAREHNHAKVTGRGRGAGSTLDFTLTFTIDEINTGSKINWVFEGTVGGLAASIGGRVLDSIARNIINDTVNNLKNQLLNLQTLSYLVTTKSLISLGKPPHLMLYYEV